MNIASTFNRFVQTAWGRVKYLVFVPKSDRPRSSSLSSRRRPARVKRIATSTRTRRLVGAPGK